MRNQPDQTLNNDTPGATNNIGAREQLTAQQIRANNVDVLVSKVLSSAAMTSLLVLTGTIMAANTENESSKARWLNFTMSSVNIGIMNYASTLAVWNGIVTQRDADRFSSSDIALATAANFMMIKSIYNVEPISSIPIALTALSRFLNFNELLERPIFSLIQTLRGAFLFPQTQNNPEALRQIYQQTTGSEILPEGLQGALQDTRPREEQKSGSEEQKSGSEEVKTAAPASAVTRAKAHQQFGRGSNATSR
jgi:hypothetical protein